MFSSVFDNTVLAKFRWSVWLGVPRAGPVLWNYPEPPNSRRINTIRQKGSAWRVLPTFAYFKYSKVGKIKIISIHTSRFGNRIKQIWQPLLFINEYLHMEYTLFQDFARKIPCPAPPTGRPGHAQLGSMPEFRYGPLDTNISDHDHYCDSFLSVMFRDHTKVKYDA